MSGTLPSALVDGYGFEALALFEAMTTKPSGQRKRLISETIKALQKAGIWRKLDIFYMLAAHDSQAACLNWKNPTAFKATENNAPTFTINRGFTGNGTSSFLDTNWKPLSNGVAFTQNNAHIAVFNLTQRVALNRAQMGTDTVHLFVMYGGNTFYGRLNDSPLVADLPNAQSTGLFYAGRSSSTARDASRNGVSLGSYAPAPSAAPPDISVVILATRVSAVSVGAYTTDQIAMASAGAYFTASEQEVYYTIVNTFLKAVRAIS